jgi:hypothetical protein
MTWPWYLALLLIVIGIGVTQRDGIVAQWTAVYPSDPAREEALHLCYIENPTFNRLRARQRESCYEKWLPAVAARTRPSPL